MALVLVFVFNTLDMPENLFGYPCSSSVSLRKEASATIFIL
jgi:hypothetical protein